MRPEGRSSGHERSRGFVGRDRDAGDGRRARAARRGLRVENISSGWGRVNLAASVIIPELTPNGAFGEGGPLNQGERSTGVIKVPQTVVAPGGLGPTLKFTLVWTDPPGAQLQNDLDLIITAANGDERHGNMGTGTGFDRQNNVEQIVWENLPPGDLKFTIVAFHITRFPQAYAFAWRIS
jgi:hypothetical protein